MKLLFASHNKHKLQELRDILAKDAIEILSLADLNDEDDVIEDGKTFKENAYKKALYFAKKYNLPTIADDSGLVVLSLDGLPGVLSHRYSSENASDLENNIHLLKQMITIENREAYFISVICFVNNNEVHYFTGRLDGFIAKDITQKYGFGYDSVFLVKNSSRLSLMSPQEKNKISHRAQALKAFKIFIKDMENNI